MLRMPPSLNKHSNKSRRIAESKMLMKQSLHSLKQRNKITVFLTLLTYLHRKLMLQRTITNIQIQKLKNINYLLNKMKLRSKERSKISRIKEMNSRKIQKQQMLSAKIFKMNLVISRVTCRKWFKCFKKLVSNQTQLKNKGMMMKLNSMKTTQETILLNWRNISLISSL